MSDNKDKPQLADSGARRFSSTGSQRDMDDNKPKMSYVFLGWPHMLWELGKHMTRGLKKYGYEEIDGEKRLLPPHRNNWTLGQPLSWYMDSAERHKGMWIMGDTNEPWHFIAMLWNWLCLGETWFMIKEGRLPEELNDIGNLRIVYDVSDEDIKQGKLY